MGKKKAFGIFGAFLDFLNETVNYLFKKKVSVIIPAFNESENIGKVIAVAKSVFEISEVIVVDDGSTDNTAEVSEKAGAKVVRHEKNLGKGAAIKTGVKHAKEDVVLFLDADLKNIDGKKIKALIGPVLSEEADFVKASFSREGGRVTELTAKPLMKHLFPKVKFNQPLSGQFCAKKEILGGLAVENRWGVDIGLLLDIASKGYIRTKEADIGEIEHVQKQLHELRPMAEQVAKTILKKARTLRKKHALIVFDLDGTLLKHKTIGVIAEKFGFAKERFVAQIREKFARKEIADFEASVLIAKMLEGKKSSEIADLAEKIPLRKNAEETVKKLKEQYEVVLISMAYRPVCNVFAKKLGVECYCPELEEKNGILTGKVIFPKEWKRGCKKHKICKLNAAKSIARRNKIRLKEVVAIGDSAGDICLFEKAGLSIAINPDEAARKKASIIISNLAEILIHVK